MSVTIYHNPRCSKSRNTLAILQEHDIQPQVVEYLKTPPDAATLKTLLSRLGMQPSELVRKGEKIFKELGLHQATTTEQQIFDAMLQNPKLIERPIVLVGDKAAVTRPPENVLNLIDAS